jgi:hypothetical protein
MNPIAGTMPEAKFRKTKKQAKPDSSFRYSEFAHEVKAVKAQPKQVKATQEMAKAESKPKEKSKFSIASFWPVAVGLFLSGFAAEWHGMAAQIGLWGMRFTFPLSLIAERHDLLGLDPQMSALLPTVALYAQLPLDGVLLMLTLARSRSLMAAVVQVTLVHAVCAFVLWLITM